MNKEVKIYVGIDFSKEKFNACLLTQAGVMGEGEFPNTKSGYQNLLKWTKNFLRGTHRDVQSRTCGVPLRKRPEGLA